MLDFLPGVAAVTIFGQTLEAADLAVIGLLVILEGVLSIDNALVLGLLAKRLPEHQRQRALTYGLVGAFVFRVIAILTASLLLQWTFVKFIGGAYLVYIAVKHLFFEAHEPEAERVELDAQGNPILVEARSGGPLSAEQEEMEIEERSPVYVKPEPRAKGGASFWPTVVVIELTDVAFAIDSILAAMALAGSRQDKLWVVVSGGILGVILMRFAAVVFIKLLEKFPRFEVSAYLLVVVIGLKLLADWGFNSDWSFETQPAFASRLGTWKPAFENLEKSRQESVVNYENWLEKNWLFGLPGGRNHGAEHPHDDNPPPADPNAVAKPKHVPHLLDFHDLRRPECMTFWSIMAVCFGIGFIKPKEQSGSKDAKPAAKH